MDVSALNSKLNAADLPLEKLAANPKISEAAKLKEVSRQFEAVLVRQILSSAQKPTFPSRMNPQSNTSGIYQDMMNNQLADKISRSGGLGLGNALAAQLTRQFHSPAPNQEPTD